MPDPITIGDIIQDCVTEQSIAILGHVDYDGIDDTDIEVLSQFVSDVYMRMLEKTNDYKRRGISVAPSLAISPGHTCADDRTNGADWGRERAQASGHPSVGGTLQEVSHQRWVERQAPGTRTYVTPEQVSRAIRQAVADGADSGVYAPVTSIIGRHRRSPGT